MTSEFETRRRALRTGAASAALCLSLLSAPAFAQAGSPTSQDNSMSAVPTGSATGSPADDEGAIVVTGSRIARRDLTSASPLTVVSSEEFKLSGAVNVENVINTLPQVVPGTTSFSNNPGGGVATLNLRNLGSQRTLVLVNGRRYMFYDTAQITDLNVIPSFLLEGIDVVTGGASAVYGSDAIAGVVNFRLRNNLVGVEVGSQYSITEQGDGARWDTHVAMGTDFADGRGHITAYAEYYKRKPVFQGDRSFSRFALQDGANRSLVQGGSATIPQGRFSAAGTQVIAAGNGLPEVTLNRAAGTNYSGLGAIFTTPRVSRAYTGADAYNFAPVNYLQVPQERFLTGAYGEYEANDHITAYMEVSFANNRVVNALAATPVTGNFNVNIANSSQYLSAADIAQLTQIDVNEAAINAANVARGRAAGLPGAGIVSLAIGRRVTETGSRIQEDERNAFRTLVGVKGDITDRLNYDAYYSYARTRNAQIQNGNISRSAFTAGVLNGTVNPFGPDTITGAPLTAITILSQNNDISVLQVASGSLSGSLFNLGMGGGDVGFAVGGEYRSVSSRFIPDTALSSGDVIGFNAGLPTAGGYNVKEAFGELNVPLVADAPFFRLLELHGAARYSDYSLDAVGGVFTYAGDVKWSPIRDITFRGQYQKAVRAPNVGELFGGQQQGFPAATDPCSVASARTNAAINTTCIGTGVPAALVGTGLALQPNTQIQGAFGGNPNLSEERSTSYTFGGVFSPTFIPRLNISVDYFNIKVNNVVATAGGGVASILDLCYNTFQDASSAICQLIQRNPQTGIIDGAANGDGTFNVVSATNANLASIKTSGIDAQVDYTQPLGFSLSGQGESRLNFAFNATWTEKNDTKLIAALPDTIECAGRFGANCGDPQAKFKWTSRLSLVDGPFTLSGRWRHVGKVRDDDDGFAYAVENLKAYNQYDLSMAFDVSDQFSLAGGVNNLLDKKPPIIGSNAQQANTYPGTYDVLGRDFFISANFRF